MRKALLVISALILFGTAQADNLKGDAVILRTLDKVTATTKDYTVKVGDELKYGSLTVAVKHCEKRPPEEVPETYTFLQITDKKLDGKGGEGIEEKLFSGWMFASRPAVSALDHGVYDVWVIDCKVPQTKADVPKLR